MSVSRQARGRGFFNFGLAQVQPFHSAGMCLTASCSGWMLTRIAHPAGTAFAQRRPAGPGPMLEQAASAL